MGFIQKYAMYGIAALLALAMIALGVQSYRLVSLQDDFDKHLLEDSKATAIATAQAKALGERVTTAVNDAAAQYEKGKADALLTAKTVTGQLNAGTVRVRTIWKCPTVAGHVSEVVGPPSELSAAERERNESAGRIIGAARSCDAQVAGLIKAYNDAKKLINHE